MTIIEIVDDAGDEFSVMNIPIPFYIRCKLNEGLTKYRVRILDESEHLRGSYIGASNREFLEVHVPVIPLQNYGKLFIYIELDKDMLNNQITHETSIAYVDQETYESITRKTRKEPLVETPGRISNYPPPIQDISHQLSSQEVRYLTLGEEETNGSNQKRSTIESSSLSADEGLGESESISDSNDQSVELSPDELTFLTQGSELFQELIPDTYKDRIKVLSEIRMEEEE